MKVDDSHSHVRSSLNLTKTILNLLNKNLGVCQSICFDQNYFTNLECSASFSITYLNGGYSRIYLQLTWSYVAPLEDSPIPKSGIGGFPHVIGGFPHVIGGFPHSSMVLYVMSPCRQVTDTHSPFLNSDRLGCITATRGNIGIHIGKYTWGKFINISPPFISPEITGKHPFLNFWRFYIALLY